MSNPPPDLLTLHAGNHPEKLALVEDRPGQEPRSWTYADLERESNQLANALLGLGLRPGDKVVWCGLNSPGIVRMVHAVGRAAQRRSCRDRWLHDDLHVGHHGSPEGCAAQERRRSGSDPRAPGVTLTLFDEDGKEITEPKVPGELYVKSKGVFTTYHKAQEKYEKGRRGEWLSVGDVAYRDADGYYYICDRKSDMIISGGMNIYPAEIESALEQHPGVADVAVFGIPSEEWGESVHAVIVPHHGETLSAEDVVTFARDRLAGYKIPRSVSCQDEIPRTASGKILKRVLRAPFWKGHGNQIL
jgi:acyl-CoA synthetase (AMP-forming)/AMP-acid ligase II